MSNANFSGILQCLKAGERVRRVMWVDGDWIQLHNDTFTWSRAKVPDNLTYTPSRDDLLAEDWQSLGPATVSWEEFESLKTILEVAAEEGDTLRAALGRHIDKIAQLTDAVRFAKEGEKTQVRTVVHTVGGEVEGAPTQTINYLQRLRALVEIEQKFLKLRKAAGNSLEQYCSNHRACIECNKLLSQAVRESYTVREELQQ